MEQQREQQGLSSGDHTIRPSTFSLYEAGLMGSHMKTHEYTTTSPIGVPRRGHAVVSATSSDWNHYSAGLSSSANQSENTTALEPTNPVFEDDQSECMSEQENQPPAEIPSTPPTENTSRRLQRDVLKCLPLDRNGQPLHTFSSPAEHPYPYHEISFDTLSQMDGDKELDTESNASTIVAPTISKRSASLIEEGQEKEDGAAGDHDVCPRPTKRMKTLHRPAKLGSPDAYRSPIHTTAKPAMRHLSTLITPSDNDTDSAEESGSESSASMILAASCKRGASHLDEDEDDDEIGGLRDQSPNVDVKKRCRSSPNPFVALRNFDIGQAKTQQEEDLITSSRKRIGGRKHHPLPANGRGKSTFNHNTIIKSNKIVHATKPCPQRNGRSYIETDHTNELVETEFPGFSLYLNQPSQPGIIAPPSSPAGLDGSTIIDSSPLTIMKSRIHFQESFYIPTPSKTPTLISIQQTSAETEPMDDVLGRLGEAEERFTRWLAEVRHKKHHYKRIMAQQQEDRRVIEKDMARFVQFEAIIRTMASEELHTVDEVIRVQEGQADRLSERRKEVRQRLLSVEKLRHDLSEKRQDGL
jgi:hypothetical protein